MKKFRVLMMICVLTAAACLFTACGNDDDTDTNDVYDSETYDNTGGGSVENDLDDLGDDALDAGEDVIDGVEDAGDAVIDGADDILDGDDAETNTDNNTDNNADDN